jgi:SAM-dependent methyltransferase
MLRQLKPLATRILPKEAKAFLKKHVFKGKRPGLAIKYIRGDGIEIGGLSAPTPVSRGVRVRFVEVYDDQQIQLHYPGQSSYQKSDFVEDGFKLPSFAAESVDFVIANHVLEHTPSTMQALKRWCEVVRPGGIVFATVPIVDRCWDAGRKTTSLSHFVEDFKVYSAGDLVVAHERNREHYIEFIDIFDRNARGKAYVKPSVRERQRLIDEHMEKQLEIHFHTFTSASYANFLGYFCQSVDSSIMVIEVVENDVELISILKKKSNGKI